MDMSAAAIAPRSPFISDADRRHPLFGEYQKHLNSCRRLMIEAFRFQDWLSQHAREQVADDAASDPRYPEFLAWMRSERAGRRRCPAGEFPANFRFWCEGGRW
ncbi:MAG: hypothetical protein KGL39_52290 [Patescibacteria group bacterium]|nr:hypothetical protein [Patescibacteria group bacterium]